MTTLDATAIAQRLHLGPDYGAWLDALEAIGTPPGGLALPQTEAAERLLAKLGLDEPDRAAVVGALPSNAEQPELWWLLERAYHTVLSDIGRLDSAARWPMLPAHLGAAARCFWVFVYLCAVPAIRQWHQDHAVPNDVSWDTLADLGRHMRLYRRRTGSVGLDVPWWIGLHFRGALFALGRLQFNPYRLNSGPAGPLFWYDAQTAESLGDGFRTGDLVLGVHIPESGPLSPAACDASFQAAATFFADHFPDRAGKLATCTSWLMDDQFLEYLAPDSNIVQFQRRFELVPGTRDADDSVFHFVFGRIPTTLSEIVPRTTLEHAIIDHLSKGRHWHLRTGWLRL